MPPKVTSKSTASGGSANAPGSEDLQKYQKMTDLEHILKKPDTYIGTNEPTDTVEYVMDSTVTAPESGDAAAAATTAATTAAATAAFACRLVAAHVASGTDAHT